MNGHNISQTGPVVLTPGGAPAAFITVYFPGPGVKGIWACIGQGQKGDEMSSWLYVTLPGAAHSVAVPSSVLAPSVAPWQQQACWGYSPATGIYPDTVLAEGVPWSNPHLKTLPMTPIVLPAGTPAFPTS